MIDAGPAALARRALAEDGARDVTSLVAVTAAQAAAAHLEVREPLVLAGTRWADEVVAACELAPVQWAASDGMLLAAGTVVGTVRGSMQSVLRAERPLLNLLQRASGIATLTRQFVDAVAGTGCRILHTRKTAPGLRELDVAAVLAGGGFAHRLDLGDAVMIKDNHWACLRASGRALADALDAARVLGVARRYVEVESLLQLHEAIAAGATRVLIDNQTAATVAEWAGIVRAAGQSVEVEATGGITLANVRAFAEAGADFVSIGALTHSARAADLALEIAMH